MMHIGAFSIDLDTIVFIITTIWAILSWLGERKKLPAEINKYVQMIGADRINKLIEDADRWQNLSNREKHALVAEEISNYLKQKYGIEVPQAYIDTIISYACKFRLK